MKKENVPEAAYYKICRLITRYGDYYAGELNSARFSGNKLSVVFKFVVKILERGEPPKWHCDEHGRVLADYGIEFEGCKTMENGTGHVKIRSEQGDTITLSCTESEIHAVHSLIGEAFEIIRDN